MESATVVFVAITAIATSIMAVPIIQKNWSYWKVRSWKNKMKAKIGECEDDNKNVYVAEEVIKYFEPRHDTYEVDGYCSVRSKNEDIEGDKKINSNGYIITIKFDRFERFVKELMMDLKEDPYVDWLLKFDCGRRFSYHDRMADVSYVYFYYYIKEKEKLVDIFTEPAKEEGLLDMRPLHI